MRMKQILFLKLTPEPPLLRREGETLNISSGPFSLGREGVWG
jgi:hypothetical protein